MRVLVIGGAGLLGTELMSALTVDGAEAVSASRRGPLVVDIKDPGSVALIVDAVRPDAVILPAANAAVDDAERDPDQAFRVNSLGARNVAAECQKRGLGLSMISTDYVFDGRRAVPYSEFDPPNPVSVYGRSKLEGERFVLHCHPGSQVVRVSALYGFARPCLALKLLEAGKRREPLRLIRNRRNSPTSARQAARVIVRLLLTGQPGVYHVTGGGDASPLELGLHLLRSAGFPTDKIEAVDKSEIPAAAERPDYSTLRNYVLELQGEDDLEPWEEETARFASEWLRSHS